MKATSIISTRNHSPQEYLAIVYWGYSLGSPGYYVKNEQWKASQDGAPLNAIYERDGDGTHQWVTIDDCSEDSGHKKGFAGWLANPNRPMPAFWNNKD